VEVLDLGHLTDAQRAELEGDEHDPFDAAGVTLEFRPKERHVALAQGGRLVASTGLTRAAVAVSGERFEVVGIGGVIVAASWRGQGLAREVVGHALQRARAMGPPFALLFCHADRAGLYERLGFTVIEAPVTVGQPAGFEPMLQQLSMWGPLAADAAWPAGPVTVYGLPF
jgi:predicted N-acetyltransferase YhbS